MSHGPAQRSSMAPAALPRPQRLRMQEFRRLREAVYDEAGIFLPDAKLLLVEARLSRRVRALQLRGYEEYCALVLDGDDRVERVQMLDAITTNETHFFREPRHFDLLRETVLPGFLEQARRGTRPMHVRAWSAACSTGEEPYSLAMCLLDALPPTSGWRIDVLASDLSTRVLERARYATWPMDKATEIPEAYLKRFMLRGFDAFEGQMRCAPELREVVSFDRLNLNAPPYPVPRNLDLVFCRNVLIYFDTESRARVVDALVDVLAPDGYLIVGHSESLHRVCQRVTPVAPGVYRHKANAQAEGD